MKFLKKMKDGGAKSTVTGYWLIEIKSLFSIVLLKFEGESRDAFHEHAFTSVSWLLKGALLEHEYLPESSRFPGVVSRFKRFYLPSIWPFITRKTDFHKVDSATPVSWVLSFRGPWKKTWREYLPNESRERTLTSGRVEV